MKELWEVAIVFQRALHVRCVQATEQLVNAPLCAV